ncbi:MAG TPA: tectonin domain-containing protein [Pyrinomonadaceae bacterium]|jgi:hypothetical protein|nr:tectonin domain-containing protein [Pyrinomonadaceae bacterium]
MGNIFTITTATTDIKADAAGKASAIFTVTNTSNKPIRGIARARSMGSTQQGWLEVEGETEKDFGAGGIQQFTVNFKSTGPEAGKFPFRLDVASANNPDEEFTEGPPINVETAAPAAPVKKGFPLWLIIVIAAAALLIVGLILLFVLRGGGEGNPVVNANVRKPGSIKIPDHDTQQSNVTKPAPIKISPVQEPSPQFIGVGTDKILYKRANLNSGWVQVPNSGSVTGVAVMPDGTIVGVGMDSNLYSRATLSSNWVLVPNSGSVTGIAVMPNGSLLGAGVDKYLYTREALMKTWQQVRNSGVINSIAVLPDGTLLSVVIDNKLYTRVTLNSAWIQVPDSGSVTSVTVMRDGTILGVGMDSNLYSRATLTSNWILVPNSGSVLSVAEMPLAK